MQKSLMIVLLISGLACSGCAVLHPEDAHLSAEEYATARKSPPGRYHRHPGNPQAWQPYVWHGFGIPGGIGVAGAVSGM
jgi:hypothetical protein